MPQQHDRPDDRGNATDLVDGVLEMGGDLIGEGLAEFVLEAAGAVVEGAASLLASVLDGF